MLAYVSPVRSTTIQCSTRGIYPFFLTSITALSKIFCFDEDLSKSYVPMYLHPDFSIDTASLFGYKVIQNLIPAYY